MSFPRTFGPRDPYSRPSTPAPDYHRVTASPSKIDIIVRKALADTARAQEQLALEIGKRTDAQASIQAISGLLQDGMANTMSALKHWELDKNSGVQFGSYTPLPLSAQSSSVFIQDESRYVYQHHQQSGAAQFLLRTVGWCFSVTSGGLVTVSQCLCVSGYSSGFPVAFPLLVLLCLAIYQLIVHDCWTQTGRPFSPYYHGLWGDCNQ